MALKMPLFAALMLAFAALSTALPYTAIRGFRSSCPASPVQCGLYMSKPSGKLIVCRKCGKEYSNQRPGLVCDWKTGKCVNNTTDEGKLCKKNADCKYGNTCQYLANSKGKIFRCAPTRCPPGLCGIYKIPYHNICGKLIYCNAKC